MCFSSRTRFSGDNFRHDFHNGSRKTRNFVNLVYPHVFSLHKLHYMLHIRIVSIPDARIFSTPFRDNHVHNSFITTTMTASNSLLNHARFSEDNFRQDFHNCLQKIANFVKPVYPHNVFLLDESHYMFQLRTVRYLRYAHFLCPF